MPLITLATKNARGLLDYALEHRDSPEPDELEVYFSPALEIQLHCTTQEREAFETDRKIELTEDCFGACIEFATFSRYLNQHCFNLELF
jgi:hypothetical protein